jgi:ADP-heptose:LPS heptosyltransferase
MKRKFSLYRTLSMWLRLPLAGPVFKLYAPRRRWKLPAKPNDPPRILIANLMPSLGDTICYMALAEVIREALPSAEITWLADSAVAGLVAQHPAVDRVLTVTSPASFLQCIPTLKSYYRLFTIMRSVHAMDIAEPFDLAIAPRGGVDPSFSAHAIWMLNLPRSVGYSRLVEPTESEHAFPDSLFTDLETRIVGLHEAARGVHLLALTGLVPDALARYAELTNREGLHGLRTIAASLDPETVLRKAGVPLGRRFIVISPVASAPRKTWPTHKFRALIERILGDSDQLIVLTGAKAEADQTAAIAMNLDDRVIDAAGKLNLNDLITLISHATAFVGNDSGAGHVAGPLGIPVISLHGQAKDSNPCHIHAPDHYRPMGPNVTVLQPDEFLPPCSGRCDFASVHCLDQITVDEVWRALKRVVPTHSAGQL